MSRWVGRWVNEQMGGYRWVNEQMVGYRWVNEQMGW